MEQQELYERFSKISPDGSLYVRFFEAGCSLYQVAVRHANARFMRSSQEIRLAEEVEGNYGNLQKLARETNTKLREHQPPLPELPEERDELGALVGNLMMTLFQNRRI